MAARDTSEVEALHRIAGTLAARGLSVTESTSPDGLAELTITNPADPARGLLHVGYEGYVIWEYWARADIRSAGTEILATITAMLTGPAQQQPPQ
jgi:hypothetical protein